MMNNLGFECSVVDHSVYFRCSEDEHMIIAVAPDDMAVTSKWLLDVIKFKSKIRQHFEIANGGELWWFLGFKIKRDQPAQTVSINQCSYIERMVKKFQLTNAKQVSTLMDPGITFRRIRACQPQHKNFKCEMCHMHRQLDVSCGL